MWLVIEDHDNLFIMAEFVHFAGIGMLLYKLFSKRSAGGIFATYLYNPETSTVQGPCTLYVCLCRSLAQNTGADSIVSRSTASMQVRAASHHCASASSPFCADLSAQACTSAPSSMMQNTSQGNACILSSIDWPPQHIPITQCDEELHDTGSNQGYIQAKQPHETSCKQHATKNRN